MAWWVVATAKSLKPGWSEAQSGTECAAQSRISTLAHGGGIGMRVLTAILVLLLSSPAAAEDCQTCSMADACMKEYVKATSEAQRATKQAIRDWKQNLDRKASAELSAGAYSHCRTLWRRRFVRSWSG